MGLSCDSTPTGNIPPLNIRLSGADEVGVYATTYHINCQFEKKKKRIRAHYFDVSLRWFMVAFNGDLGGWYRNLHRVDNVITKIYLPCFYSSVWCTLDMCTNKKKVIGALDL